LRDTTIGFGEEGKTVCPTGSGAVVKTIIWTVVYLVSPACSAARNPLRSSFDCEFRRDARFVERSLREI
jgi:hypothetical protein